MKPGTRRRPRPGWVARLLRPLRRGDAVAPGWTVGAVRDDPPAIELCGPGGAVLPVRLAARDDRPAYAVTRSFAVYYLADPPGRPLGADAEAALRAVVAAVVAGDERLGRRSPRLPAPLRLAPRSRLHDPTLDRDAYRAAVRELVRREGRPAGVVLTVDSPCDLRCSFCTRGAGGIVPPHRTLSSLDDLRFQVETLAATGAGTLDFGGDEPMSHPALPRIVRFARRRGFRRVTVATAGVRLGEPGVAAELAAAGVEQVRVPLYGSIARVHDAVTGVSGSFRRTVAGLRAARAAGLRVELRTLALRGNLDSLPGLERLAARLGLDPPSVGQVAPRSDDPADFRRNAPAYAAVVRALRGSSLRLAGFPLCLRRLADAAGTGERFVETADRPPRAFGSPDPVPPWRAPHYPPCCRGCALRGVCPGTYALYVALHGDAELRPVPRRRGPAVPSPARP